MFQNRVLKKVFGPNMDDVTEGQRKLKNKSFATCTVTKYCYGDSIKEYDMGGALDIHGER